MGFTAFFINVLASIGVQFLLFSFGFYSSNFRTDSVLKCDTLARISGGSPATKRFQFKALKLRVSF